MDRGKANERSKLDGLSNEVLAFIRTMFSLRLTYAKGELSGAMDFGQMRQVDATGVKPAATG